MPPYLHPRSAATSTLFAGTLLASFVVVGIPHVFPCPRPRRSYADSQKQLVDADTEADKEGAAAPTAERAKGGATTVTRQGPDQAALFRQLQHEAALLDREAHECPVPKPGGWLGQVLGFERAAAAGEAKRPAEGR